MLGNKIRIQRERMNWNQAELAEKFGIKQKAVSNWERDITAVSVEQLQQLSELFSVPITYWFDDNVEVPAEDNVSKLIKELMKDGTISNVDDVKDDVADLIISAVRLNIAKNLISQKNKK